MLASVKSRLGDRKALLTSRAVTIGVVVVLLIAIGAAALILLTRANHRAVGAAGQAIVVDSLSDGTLGMSDALAGTFSGLDAPASGTHYDAWLVDAQTGHALLLGELTPHASGSYTLTYVGDGSGGRPGTNLLSITLRPKLEITQERGTAKTPSRTIVLESTLPPGAFQHIRHLLYSWDTTPGKIGFLVGLLEQTRLLDQQALILQRSLLTGENDYACVAQSLLDIIEGAQGANYRPIPSGCDTEDATLIGDGYGILGDSGYLAGTTDHASLAAQSPDATNAIHTYAGNVELAATNIKGWVTTIEQDAVSLVANPNDTSRIGEIATLAERAYYGTGVDANGQANSTVSEAGALTAYWQGQRLAAFALVRPS